MGLKDINYHREITHQSYQWKNKIGDKGQQSWLPKEICDEFNSIANGDFKYVSEDYIVAKVAALVTPIIGGSSSLLIVLVFIRSYFIEGDFNGFEMFIFCISIFFTLFFTIYLFTIPKKEIILNRKEGIITFPGWYWKENITMSFNAIKFGYTTGGPNATSAYCLQILRPDKMGSYQLFALGDVNCFKGLSFITWYMDKNRPLPPGEAFDEFRDIDFERRKKEGFPKPLYYSQIPTPEATPQQQKQREKYWVG